MGAASLVLGIIALVCTFFGSFGWIGVIVGIIGIILGAMAKKRNPSGVATAGFVCSIIGTVICGIGFLACAACVGGLASLGAGL
ncbi:MAG: hypothetical protein IKM67_04890 [Clostridia bacterium]|nr:hypothetical protein [Clostridia bacterium]MBR2472612.1 hypothetical protein [Clostridia bacterium]MBR3866033.1 hypothetical protein [Clostridia bacterium]